MNVSQYLSGQQKQDVNNLIEEAILEADKKGAKVLSLGLLNQVISLYIRSLAFNHSLYSFISKLSKKN